MTFNQAWLKPSTFEFLVYPQLRNFCGIAACCNALGCILGRKITEQELHRQYQVGMYTKLQLPAGHSLDKLDEVPRIGRGFSNWDIVRLLNAVLLDSNRQPFSVILCGEDFVRETRDAGRFQKLLEWVRDDSAQIIVHIVDHYAVVGGLLSADANDGNFLLLADSSRNAGPMRTFALAELAELASRDPRYGFVLVSDKPIPRNLFGMWTEQMTPPEVTHRQRFERINETK